MYVSHVRLLSWSQTTAWMSRSISGSSTCHLVQAGRWVGEGSWQVELTATTERPAAGWKTPDWRLSSFVTSSEPERERLDWRGRLAGGNRGLAGQRALQLQSKCCPTGWKAGEAAAVWTVLQSHSLSHFILIYSQSALWLSFIKIPYHNCNCDSWAVMENPLICCVTLHYFLSKTGMSQRWMLGKKKKKRQRRT